MIRWAYHPSGRRFAEWYAAMQSSLAGSTPHASGAEPLPLTEDAAKE
jgi:hypothetical protein